MVIAGGMWLSIPFLDGSDIPWLPFAHSAVLLLALFGWFLVCSRRKHFEAAVNPAGYSFNAPSVEATVDKPSFRKRLIRWFRAS